MRREMRIFAYKQTHNQAENSKTEAHSNPLWSVDRRGAGQYNDRWMITYYPQHFSPCMWFLGRQKIKYYT